MGLTTAIIASAIIGAGTSAQAASQQRKAQKEAQAKRDEAKRIEDERLAAIAADTKPQEESATLEFGAEDTGNAGGNFNDFLVTKTGSSKLGSQGTSGLSGNNLSSLGMGA